MVHMATRQAGNEAALLKSTETYGAGGTFDPVLFCLCAAAARRLQRSNLRRSCACTTVCYFEGWGALTWCAGRQQLSLHSLLKEESRLSNSTPVERTLRLLMGRRGLCAKQLQQASREATHIFSTSVCLRHKPDEPVVCAGCLTVQQDGECQGDVRQRVRQQAKCCLDCVALYGSVAVMDLWGFRRFEDITCTEQQNG